MSRHRNIRSLDYHKEYDEAYGDLEYGQSVEDDYVMSPGAAMYMYDRGKMDHVEAYIHSGEDIQEEEEEESEEDLTASRRLHRLDSASYTPPVLSDIDRARLSSCLDEVQNVVGESFPEHILIEAVISSDFDCEKALNELLSNTSSQSKDEPKPQREKRKDRGYRSEATVKPDAVNMEDVDKLLERMQRLQSPIENVDELPKNIQRLQPPIEDVDELAKKMQRLQPPIENVVSVSSDEIQNMEFEVNDVNSEPEATSKIVEPSAESEKVLSQELLVKTPRPKDRRKDASAEYEAARGDDKVNLNMVVIGHVDAGKSTLMGHLLYQLGAVSSRAMHKYEQESKKLGKQSFMYAWVLDETGEERSRGITMDVGQSTFMTDNKSVNLLDAPGHKDFIPNMITGAAQADTAILVVDATRGEFETGFDSGGQTREHAFLVRSLGVSQLAVAINKLDTVDWSQERFEGMKSKLRQFLLKNVGFRDVDLFFVPVSGLSGENLTKPASEPKLTKWYDGPSLLQVIDQLRAPERPVSKPFRLSVSDVWKGQGSGICVGGKIETGMAVQGEKILIMPQGEQAQIKGISINEVSTGKAFAGDQVVLTLFGTDIQNVGVGSVVCELGTPIPVTNKIEARIVIFNITVPITKGFPAIFYNGTISEPCTITRLKSQLHRSTGEVVKEKPRYLTKQSSAIVNLQLNKPVPLEPYNVSKELGRFTIRNGGVTIAAGLVTKIL